MVQILRMSFTLVQDQISFINFVQVKSKYLIIKPNYYTGSRKDEKKITSKMVLIFKICIWISNQWYFITKSKLITCYLQVKSKISTILVVMSEARKAEIFSKRFEYHKIMNFQVTLIFILKIVLRTKKSPFLLKTKRAESNTIPN